MKKPILISHEQLEQLKAKLLATPAPIRKAPDLGKREAIKAMAKEIHELQKRGFSLVEVAELLKKEGLEVSPPTLKSYISAPKKKAVAKPTAETAATAP